MNHLEHASKQSEGLAHKVLDQIAEQGIAPRPRWQYVMRNVSFWVFWIVSIILGACLTAALIFAFANAGWEYRELTHESLFSFAFQVAPVLWIAMTFGALLLAYEIFRHTKVGYRTPLRIVLGFSLLIMLLGGGLLYFVGVGRFVEEDLGQHIPQYRPAMMRQRQQWSHPDQGLLGGEVLEVGKDFSTFKIRAFDGNVFVMSGVDLGDVSREVLVRYPTVRVVGIFSGPQLSNDQPFFRPCYVFPWEHRGPFTEADQACSDSERIIDEARSSECKGLIPYPVLMALQRGACR